MISSFFKKVYLATLDDTIRLKYIHWVFSLPFGRHLILNNYFDNIDTYLDSVKSLTNISNKKNVVTLSMNMI